MYGDDYSCAGCNLFVETGKEAREARVKAFSPLEVYGYCKACPQVLKSEHAKKPGLQEHAPEEHIHIRHGKVSKIIDLRVELCHDLVPYKDFDRGLKTTHQKDQEQVVDSKGLASPAAYYNHQDE